MKIMIFGDPASGKSTFACKLAKLTNISVIHLDEIMDNIGRDDKDAIKKLIIKEIARDNWIIEGNAFTKDKDSRINSADVVFVFDSGPIMTLLRHLTRYLKVRFGIERRLGKEDTTLDLRFFLPYIFLNFPRRKKCAIDLVKQQNKKFFLIKEYSQTTKYLSNLDWMNSSFNENNC
ncbi:MAG: Topology modulation protein [uncultured bacterium]|nr:MAG: Topology modulation protein [uncultured bacterium]